MALSRIEQMAKMCSTVPFMPDRKPFCKDGLMMLFCRRNFSSLLARILWNSLETTGVRAMGRKLLGWEGLSPLGIKIISAWYHEGGPVCKVSRILVNTVAKKMVSARDVLQMEVRYPTCTRG